MDKLTKVSLIATHVHRPPLLRIAFGSGDKGDRLHMSFVLAFEQEERGRELIYAARVRAGLVPATRRSVFEKIKHLKAAKCPFANLPELSDGRWGAGLTAEKMKECVWLLCRIRHSSHWTKPLRGTR